MPELKIWLMHDNHTFTLLPNNAEAASAKIAELLENGSARCGHIFYRINEIRNNKSLYHQFMNIDGDRKFVQDTKKFVKDAINAYAEYKLIRPKANHAVKTAKTKLVVVKNNRTSKQKPYKNTVGSFPISATQMSALSKLHKLTLQQQSNMARICKMSAQVYLKEQAICEIHYLGIDGNPYPLCIGVNDIIKIEEYEESGEYSNIPYIRVFKKDYGVFACFCKHKLLAVFYEESK